MKNQRVSTTESATEDARDRRKDRARQVAAADLSRPWDPPSSGTATEDDNATYDETPSGG